MPTQIGVQHDASLSRAQSIAPGAPGVHARGFAENAAEWGGAWYTPGMEAIRRHYREVKTVLRRHDLADPYFVGKFSLSPYQACAHGCRYCDGRAERYYVEGDFEHDIVIRSNIAEVLERELDRVRERGIVFIGSGISDAYQPPEAHGGLMRSCARILADHAMPVTVLTKSALIRRDRDTWLELNESSGFLLMVSLVTLDDDLRRIFEPGAGSVDERCAILREFKSSGCAIGVAAMPLLPFLCDSEKDLCALSRRLAEIGVDFVLFGGLTLRPGRQKDCFFETLERSHPQLRQAYAELYNEDRLSGAPRAEYSTALHRRAVAAFAEVSLSTVIPHRIYRGRLPLYDEVYVLLNHLVTIYGGRGEDVRRLKACVRIYHDWLLDRKKLFNRRRSQRAGEIEQELMESAESGRLAALLGNAKLACFLREVIIDRRIFDDRICQLT